MNTHYLYLIIDIGTVLFPLLFSFEKKISFYKQWKYLVPAIILTAIPFLFWDHFYTISGIWGFNERYISGINFFDLPIEEILFFFTIPYACMFIYVYLNTIFPKITFFDRHRNVISVVIIGLCLILTLFFIERLYTSVVCLMVIFLLSLHTFLLKSEYMGKFWRFFAVMLVPFLIVNGILTGTGIPESVFWYNKETIMNFRLGTIPLEDLFFSLALMLINITLYEGLKGIKQKVEDKKVSSLLIQKHKEIIE